MLLTTYCSMSPKTPLKQRPSSPIVPINKGETTLYMYKIIAFKKFFVTGFRLVKQIHFLKGCFIIIILVLFYNVSKVYSEHAKYFFSWSKDGNHIYYIATDTFSIVKPFWTPVKLRITRSGLNGFSRFSVAGKTVLVNK